MRYSLIMKVIVYSDCAHLCDAFERHMPSQPREILDLTSRRVWAFDTHSCLFPVQSPSTITSGYSWGCRSVNQKIQHVFRNQPPSSCGYKLHQKREALSEPTQRNLHRDVTLENNSHLFSEGDTVSIYLFNKNHPEQLPQSSLPSPPWHIYTHTALIKTWMKWSCSFVYFIFVMSKDSRLSENCSMSFLRLHI